MLLKCLKEMIDGKTVLLLGFGREGRAVYRRICEAGGFASLGIADAASFSRFAEESVELFGYALMFSWVAPHALRVLRAHAKRI
jgi:UDP-N-acetylmuramoylalanine-D-glutamate ligase